MNGFLCHIRIHIVGSQNEGHLRLADSGKKGSGV